VRVGEINNVHMSCARPYPGELFTVVKNQENLVYRPGFPGAWILSMVGAWIASLNIDFSALATSKAPWWSLIPLANLVPKLTISELVRWN